jgi:hypothetical protein
MDFVVAIGKKDNRKKGKSEKRDRSKKEQGEKGTEIGGCHELKFGGGRVFEETKTQRAL